MTADDNDIPQLPVDPDPVEETLPATVEGTAPTAMEKAGLMMSDLATKNAGISGLLFGAEADSQRTYIPPELVGGTVPDITGQENSIVWQAAAEAVDNERVRYVYSIHEGSIWYLAVRASDLASYVGTWCPFAALLPGQPRARKGSVVYLHIDDEAATMMSIGETLLQVHRGAAMVIKAKAERMAAELGDAPIVQMLPDFVDQLMPVNWRGASLMEDRARRLLATLTVMIGLGVAVLAFVIWMLASLATVSAEHSAATAQQQAQSSSELLLTQATQLRNSDLRNAIAKFVELNDNLIQVGGWLKEYTVAGTTIKWRAVLPAGVTGEKISALGGRTKEVTDQGLIVEGGS